MFTLSTRWPARPLLLESIDYGRKCKIAWLSRPVLTNLFASLGPNTATSVKMIRKLDASLPTRAVNDTGGCQPFFQRLVPVSA